LQAAQESIDSGRQALGESTTVPLVNAVAKMVLSYADTRKAEGLLEFQDLLVLSCELLSDSNEARGYFQSRFTHVLIDEFQDTDPLQLKLAKLLTDRSDTGTPASGALFVVGDEKQSIYRFRRADLTQLKGLVDSLGAERLSLTSNYRSTPAILEWVNSIFEPWMNGPEGSEKDPMQAEYVALEPARTDDGHTEIPRVMIAGDIADGNVDVAREAESEDIARLAEDVGAGGWSLRDRHNEAYRSNFRDLCVLMPRRTALPALEEAFNRREIPYVLEGQAPIFESQTFHELSNSLAAIDDPTDQVAIVAALKSVAWGCSDQDLYEWARLDHRFEYAHDRVDPGVFPEGSGVRRVADALAGIADFHDRRQEQSTPYLIEQFIRDRRLREVSALLDSSGNGERLMDTFIEMSRSLQRSGTGSLREFVRWLSRQASANVRTAEGALANSEVNAVRVMTIHAAKGLEFPIVALMGLQSQRPARSDNSIITEQNGSPVLAVRLGAKGLGLATSNFDRADATDKEADSAELVRLAYVGATRAREHLVVSVHRTSRHKNTLAGKISEFADLNEDLWETFGADGPGKQGTPGATESKGSAPEIISMDDRKEWILQLNDAVSRAKKPEYLTPSKLADHSMFVAPKPEDNAESTEWNTARRGRGGTDVGSAVHAVLQDVDFDDLTALDDLAQMSADAYSIPDQRENITRLVRNVLESPVVAAATRDNSWREAWVAAEIAPGLEVEGSIDLIIRNADGTITIVDYKTDRVSGEQLVERAKGYEPQLAGYALVIEKLGLPGMTTMPEMKVKEAVLVFADGGVGGKAYEHRIADLDAAKTAAIEKIRSLV
jgi:ATP-dependent exoDNAse (exonuclease V) beta subunit